MRKFVTSAVALAALAGTALAGAGAANAAISVGFDIGNVAVGYSDGYWDNAHHWHKWAHRDDLAHYRAAHADSYHEWRHDDKNHH
jgi:hypothetical protein